MRRALLSVSDKTGIIEIAQALAKAGVELISTGGTARSLREAGLDVADISEITGFPEMMDGRLKTLHPIVHGGMLYLRGNVEHESQAREHAIEPIDFVIVNLYPFEQTIAADDCTLARAIENIDIGGPTMLRSAAKNHAAVTVVVDPADYDEVAAQVAETGQTTPELRSRLAAKVFRTTSHYDTLIADYLDANAPGVTTDGSDQPTLFSLAGRKAQSLRYGENPHQSAALYGDFHRHFEQLHGKELSYNNIVDINAAVALIGEFRGEAPTVAILKHTNPCGLASADTLRAAWDAAFETDKQAPFGGIIACNQPLDLPLAEAIREIFSEVIIAPSFAEDALALLQKKKNLRLILNKQFDAPVPPRGGVEVKSILGGSFLVQQPDSQPFNEADWKVVTKRQPTDEEMAGMKFAWKVCKHVKSNAIVYAKGERTLGIGAGQMARVDSSRIAVWKAGEAGLDLVGSIMASEALLPFADGLEAAAQAGATAVIQTGGAKRDDEVIAAADAANMAMVFTGRRHFKH